MSISSPTQAIIAASYERVSTKVQGQQGFSLAAQHRTMEDFAAAQGWLLPAHLRFRDGEDENASGTRWDLPGQTAMLEAAARGEFTILIAPAHDRFARTLVKGLVLEEQLRKHGVRVIYQQAPVEDTPEGRLLKNQLYSFAEYEREKFIMRTVTGRQQKARSGRFVGQGMAPFGYRVIYETLPSGKQRTCGLEPDPTKAAVVQRVFQELRHHSCQDVADMLNADGLTTSKGYRWTARSVRRMALTTAYMGVFVFGSKEHDTRLAPEERQGIPVPVPALVDRATWDAVQGALERRKSRRKGRTAKAEDPFLLRSHLTCGHCGRSLITNVNNRVRYYGCLCHKPYAAAIHGRPVCDLPNANAERLEEELWNVIAATLLDAEYLERGLAAARSQHDDTDRLRQERLAAIETELSRQRRRLDTLAARLVDAGDGEVFNALMRQAKEIEDLIGRLTRERAEFGDVRTGGLSEVEAMSVRQFAQEIAAGLTKATLAERRRIIKLLDIRGTLYADPDGVQLTTLSRFRIDWRGVIALRDNGTSFKKVGFP